MVLFRKIMPLITLTSLVLVYLSACAMVRAVKTIPAPNGCEECHSVPISTSWQVTYRPATLSDESTRAYFQTEEYMQRQIRKPESPAQRQKVEELSCFECHNAPDSAHRSRKGTFHH